MPTGLPYQVWLCLAANRLLQSRHRAKVRSWRRRRPLTSSEICDEHRAPSRRCLPATTALGDRCESPDGFRFSAYKFRSLAPSTNCSGSGRSRPCINFDGNQRPAVVGHSPMGVPCCHSNYGQKPSRPKLGLSATRYRTRRTTGKFFIPEF